MIFRFTKFICILSSLLLGTLSALAQTRTDSPQPCRIIVGMEYVLIEDEKHVKELAKTLAEIGAPTAKHYAEHVEWAEMQKKPDSEIDFTRLDNFVREFQAAGFTELVICLKSGNPWASKGYNKLKPTNLTPKPEHLAAYEKWIGAVVERYDGDGKADMPGLKHPVRFYEIGSEFSTYEPESADEYLPMLESAYRAAHKVYDKVLIGHAAFLTTTAFKDNPKPSDYEKAFAAVTKRIKFHGLDEMRKILDAPKCFDFVNLHAIGDPLEIEANVVWLNYEMRQRKYTKPIVISDTSPTPFIAWGPANIATLKPEQMGLIVPPATEADRPRLAEFFTKLVDGDEKTVRWAQGFVAADTVKKVVIAAEQNVWLINTSFTEDLVWLKLKFVRAGAGVAAWGGMLDVPKKEKRAGFYALQQLMRRLNDYDSIQRVPVRDPRVRLYEIRRKDRVSWLAWFEPEKLILPGDEIPSTIVELPSCESPVTVEPVITRFDQFEPERTTVRPTNSTVKLTLTPTPIYVEMKTNLR